MTLTVTGPQACTLDCTLDCTGGCSGCGRHLPDAVGLSLPADDLDGTIELGFCSTACLVVYVRAKWIEVPR